MRGDFLSGVPRLAFNDYADQRELSMRGIIGAAPVHTQNSLDSDRTDIMGNKQSPALAKLVGAIRRNRKRAGLTQAELAAAVPCSDKTISAIETGRERPSREMTVAIEHALGLPPDTLVDLYDLLDVESLPRWMRDWVAEERRATSLRSLQLTAIPGLLQIEEYACALLPGNDAAVQARMERQDIFTQESPPAMRTVLDESVLYREKGGTQVMHNQLMHLAELVSERLTIQIVPAGVNPRLSGSFVLASVDGREVAYVDTAVRGIVTSSHEDIAHLEDVWETVRAYALSQQQSLDFIRKVAEERWT
jgi:transcriptional regulator with XRE-family HTH domain